MHPTVPRIQVSLVHKFYIRQKLLIKALLLKIKFMQKQLCEIALYYSSISIHNYTQITIILVHDLGMHTFPYITVYKLPIHVHALSTV